MCALLTALFALWVTVGMVRIAERGVRVEQLLLVSSCRSLDSCGIRHLRIPLPETSATVTRSDWSCRRSAGTRLAWQSQMCQERQASKLAGGDVKSDLSLGGGVKSDLILGDSQPCRGNGGCRCHFAIAA